MGLFNRKKEEKEEVPSLAKLPKLPGTGDMNNQRVQGQNPSQNPPSIHRLPSYPPGSLGTKFSQDTIKEAVAGERSDNEPPINNLPDRDKLREMQGPPAKIQRRTEEMVKENQGMNQRQGGTAEPVFIRIDRFEEAMQTFNEAKQKISEIERVLAEIKKVKDKEEEELQSWETEVRSMKEQIAKIDRDVFSKI